jgi:Flp pilus assembly protein TadD
VSDQVQTLGNSALQAANAHDWSRAVEQMGEALTLCGSCSVKPILHRNLGLIYARQGEIVQAQRELRVALRLAPDDADAQAALKILNDLSVKR